MTVRRWVCGALAVTLAFAISGAGQEKGTWRAASKTAHSITGDVAFGNEKMLIGLTGFPIAQIRDLQAAELGGAFEAPGDRAGKGNLYRVSIPGTKTFLHRNTLCGGEETQWMATYVAGKTLQLAFFSGAQMPVLTAEALANATNLCGTYTYVR